MKEIRIAAQTFLINAVCEECDVPMVFTGACYPMSPPLYEHECPKCKKLEKIRGRQYPRVIHEIMKS